MVSRIEIGEIYSILAFPKYEYVDKNQQEEWLSQILTGVDDKYNYEGEFQSTVYQNYNHTAHQIPLNILVILRNVLKERPFLSLHPKNLTLLDALNLITPTQIDKLRGSKTENECIYACREVVKRFEEGYQQLPSYQQQVITLRKREFEHYQLAVSEDELLALYQDSREVQLTWLQCILTNAERTAQLNVLLGLFRKQSATLYEEKAKQKADEMEQVARTRFKDWSVPRLKKTYPQIDGLVNIEQGVKGFLQSQTTFTSRYYRLDMTWEDFANQLSTYYSELLYVNLVQELKRGVFGVYMQTIKTKSLMLANTAGIHAGILTRRLQQKLIQRTPLRYIYLATKGVASITTATVKGLNQHIFQRGVRVLKTAREMTKKEVSNQAAKRGKWGDEETQNLLTMAILEDLLDRESVQSLVYNQEELDLDTLYLNVAAQSDQVCEEVSVKGLAHLKDKMIQQNIAVLSGFLELDLTEISQQDGYEFDLDTLILDYGKVLKHHYGDLLSDTAALDNQLVVDDLVRNIGYRTAHRYILQAYVTEQEQKQLRKAIAVHYKKAKESLRVEYKVSEEDFLQHVGGVTYFAAQKKSLPLTANLGQQIQVMYEELIAKEVSKLPFDELGAPRSLKEQEEQLSSLLTLSQQGVVSLELKGYTAPILVTRTETVWGLKLNLTDVSECRKALTDSTNELLNSLKAKSIAAIEVYDVNDRDWRKVDWNAVRDFSVVDMDEVPNTTIQQCMEHWISSHFKALYREATQQGFRFHTALENPHTALTYLMEKLELAVNIATIPSVSEQHVKEILKDGIIHAILTMSDKAAIRAATVQYIKENNIKDSKEQSDILDKVNAVPESQWSQLKVLFHEEKTSEQFYLHILQLVQSHKEERQMSGNERFEQAKYQVEKALKQISRYTHHDHEAYHHLLQYVKALQTHFEKAEGEGVVNVQSNPDQHLIVVSFSGENEVFIFHPQFIVNAVSHKVYTDRTGVLHFTNSFTSDFDYYLEKDIVKLVQFIEASRQADPATMELTEQDEKRMERLQHYVKMYANDVKGFDLSFIFYKQNNKVVRCQVVVKGIHIYALNPNFILEIPTNKVVFKRKDKYNTLADMHDQFLYQSSTPYLNKTQFRAFYTLITEAFDLRKSIPHADKK